jgi:hypothetical protein
MANINPNTQALIGRINQKLDTLGQRADALQTLSENNQQALVAPDGPLMTAISGLRQRIQALQQGIQAIIDSKTALEQLVNQTDVNLGALEQRLQQTIRQIDVQPLVEQLKPLSDEIDRLAAMIDAASNAPPPSGDRPARPTSRPASRPVSPSQSEGDDQNQGMTGGYIIPRHKKRSTASRSMTRKSGSKSSSKSGSKSGKRSASRGGKKTVKKH